MSKWECPKCGRANLPDQRRCQVCKTRNPARLRTSLDRQRHQARMKGFKEGNGR